MNHKRKKPRTISRGPKHYPMGSRKGEAPSFWNIIFHSRPKRRKNKANSIFTDNNKTVSTASTSYFGCLIS